MVEFQDTIEHQKEGRDSITGLPLKWELEERLIQEKSRAERHSTEFSVIGAVVDDFVCFRRYGPNIVDLLLRDVAAAVKGAIRTEDIVGRWGQDLFIFVLPDTDVYSAVRVAEKIRGAVANLPEREEVGRITLSIGVAEHKLGLGIDSCLEAVGHMLESAVHAGGNRVEFPPAANAG